MDLQTFSRSMAFGTYKLRGQECEDAVYHAITSGYRVIDTAVIYKNHKAVGVGIQRAISDGICNREELFITTKVFNGDQKSGREAILASMETARIDLQLDKLDLILLHRYMPDHWKAAWMTMQELQQSGVTTHIGVSNYYANELVGMCGSSTCMVMPAVNQIEISPFHVPHETIRVCKDMGILIQAHTPLIKAEKFHDVRLMNAAESEGKSVAQLLLAWSLSKGWCLAVRSHVPAHISENWLARNMKLTKASLLALDSIKEHYVTHPKLLGDPVLH